VLPLFVKAFSLVLAAIAISKSYVDFRARAESFQMFLLWTLTWAAIVVVALFPTIVDLLLSYSGSGSAGLGTVFGMALVFLFFVVYRIYAKLERVEQSLIKTIQELALKEIKK
jgi:small membrane protein